MTQEADFPTLGFNPAPGDLEALRGLVGTVRRVVREGETAQTELNKIGAGDGIWAGKAATAFSDSVSEIPPYLRNALGSLGAAQRALESWERSLTSHQERARKLEREAAAAAQRVSAAQGGVDGLPRDAEGMSGEEKDEHEKEKKAKQAALTSANDELEDVRRRARSLNAEFVSAGDDTARQLARAADNAPPEPGWLDRALGGIGDMFGGIQDFLEEHRDLLKFIGDICADIAMVVGVICVGILIAGLFFSGVGVPFALGLIGTIAAAGALLGHGGAMIGGHPDVTWQTLAWDAAGLVAGGIGLRGTRLVSSGRGMVNAGQGIVTQGENMIDAGRSLRASGGLLAQLKGLRLSPSSLGEGVRNSLRGISQGLQGRNVVNEGARVIMEGQRLISRGNFFDKGGLFSGLGLSGGSNLNPQRWLDGDWNISDVPVLGPISDFRGPQQETRANSAPPRPFDASTALSSAGNTFTGGLTRSRMGPAA